MSLGFYIIRSESSLFRLTVYKAAAFDVLNILIAVFSASLLAYGLSVDGRGNLAFTIALISILSMMVGAIITKYELVCGHLGYIPVKLISRAILELIVAVLLVYLLLFWMREYIITDTLLLFVAMFNVTFLFLGLLLQRLLLSLRMFDVINISTAYANFMYLVSLIALYFFNYFSVVNVLISNVIMQLCLVLLYSLSLKNSISKEEFDGKYYKRLKGSTGFIKLLYQEIVFSLLILGPLLFVSKFFGNSAAGSFRIATTFQDFLMKLPRIMNFVQRGFNISSSGGWKRTILLCNYTHIALLFISTLILICGDVFIPMLFSEKYSDVTFLAFLMSLSAAPWASCNYLFTQINIKKKYPVEVNYLLTTTLTAVIVVIYLMREYLDIQSLAIFIVVTYYILLVGIFYLVRKQTKLKWRHFLILK